MHDQKDEDTLVSGDVYADNTADNVPTASLVASEGAIFRRPHREVPRGDACEDSDSDIYTAGGDRDFEDDDSFRAKVREEERKIMSEFNLTGDLYSTTSSGNGGAAPVPVSGSPEHLGKKMLWAGSIGTNDDGSIFDNSYNGILDRLRTFAPGKYDNNNNTSSPKGTEKTAASPSNSNSPLPVGPTNSWEDFNGSPVPGPGIVPPSTIIVNTGDQQRHQQRHKRRRECRVKPQRLIAALAILLLVAIAVAAGTWAVSNRKNDSSKSAVSDTVQDLENDSGENDSPEIGVDPPFTVSVPSPSPTIVVAVEKEETPPPSPLPVEETASPTTNEPTEVPSEAPSEKPTASPTTNEPTEVPSEALTEKPMARPTLFPSTAAPSADPTEGLSGTPTPCGDDPDATFLISDVIGEQGCAWLADKPGHRTRFCREGNEGYLYCKSLCGVCSASTTATTAPSEADVSTSAPTTTDELVEETESPTTSEPTEGVAETEEPTGEPTGEVVETEELTSEPTAAETEEPTSEPMAAETDEPTIEPTAAETEEPTSEPTVAELDEPTSEPTAAETDEPTAEQTSLTRTARETILDFSPSSVAALGNQGSSQARALDWLETSGYENLEEWEIAQTWAVASFGLDSEVNGWFSSGNWLNRAGDECNWFGIECNGEKRVTGINLGQNNMVGNLLTELSLLESLTTLDVSRNGMSGTFPGSIGSLTRLTNLEIDRNRFSGQLPSQMGQLSRLQNLRLEFNRFTGTLPATLRNLAGLEELVIFSNSFSGSVPEEFCSMENLFSLEADCREIACDCCTRCWFQCGGSTGIPCN